MPGHSHYQPLMQDSPTVPLPPTNTNVHHVHRQHEQQQQQQQQQDDRALQQQNQEAGSAFSPPVSHEPDGTEPTAQAAAQEDGRVAASEEPSRKYGTPDSAASPSTTTTTTTVVSPATTASPTFDMIPEWVLTPQQEKQRLGFRITLFVIALLQAIVGVALFIAVRVIMLQEGCAFRHDPSGGPSYSTFQRTHKLCDMRLTYSAILTTFISLGFAFGCYGIVCGFITRYRILHLIYAGICVALAVVVGGFVIAMVVNAFPFWPYTFPMILFASLLVICGILSKLIAGLIPHEVPRQRETPGVG